MIRFLQYAFIAIVVMTTGFSLYQWNESRAALKVNTNQNLNTSGLVGHWTLDGTDTIWTSSTAGTTLDKSGNGNTGTLTNMNRATTPASGKLGQGMNLGGDVVNGKYVDFGSATSLDNIETQTGNGMTVSAWINPRSGGGYNVGTIVGKATDPDVGSGHWSFGMSNSGNIKFQKGYSTTLFSVSSRASSIELNKWQHVLVTWDGSENASNTHIYINGIESNYLVRNNGVGTKGSDAGASLLVGGPNRFFDGAIDDVRVYNRALSASEISDLYQMGGVKENTSALQPQGIGNLNSGLTGYWKFDDGSGSTAADSSGNANTGTLVNTPTWTTGQIEGGIGLLNASAQYVSLGNPSTYDLTSTGQMTISAWVKSGSSIINSTLGILKRGATNTVNAPDQYALTSSNTRWRFMAGNGTTYTEVFGPSGGLVANTWYHLTGVIDAANLSLYIDGVSAATPVARPAGSPPVAVSTFIGAMMAGGNAWDGTIDEVRIYNRALSADEISRLYRLTTPTGVDTSLKGYWSLDGNATNWTSSTTGTTADLSSYNNTGTLTNMNRATSPAIGTLGQSMDFVGTGSQKIDLGSPASLDDLEAQGGGGMTISTWINPRTAGAGEGTIINKGNAANSSNGAWSLKFNHPNGRFAFSKSYSTSTLDRVAAAGSLSYNKWQHVVMTWDGSASYANVHLYVDGGETSYHVTNQDGVGTKVSDAANSISINDGASSREFDGKIDEVRVYNRILSLSEITDLYQTGVKKINTTQDINTNGLVGHWTLDGKDTIWSSASAGTTLDTSGNGNTGTLTNMNRATTPTIGKIGQALRFDGVNDYINLGTPGALGFTGVSSEFTIAAWLKPTATARVGIMKRGHASSGGTANQYSFGTYTSNNLEFQISDGVTSQTITSAANSLPLNVWSFVSCGMSTTTLECFVNGVSVASDTRTINASSGNTTTIIGSVRTDTGFFTGDIDDVRVYDRALSNTEISYLYTSGR